MKVTAFPLQWPAHKPRTTAAERKAGQALKSISASAVALRDALGLLGSVTGHPVTDIVISSNVTLDQARPADPGVAVYFDWYGAGRVIACDEHAKPEANLGRIYDRVEEVRAMARSGTVADADLADALGSA